MLYQNILGEASPYQAQIVNLGAFGVHRHADIEINYCISGSFEAVIDDKNYVINEGEMILISPMVAHSFPHQKEDNKRVLSVIVGVSLLKNFFSYFSKAPKDVYLISKMGGSDIHEKLYMTLTETVELCQQKETRNDLLICGNLYKMCSYLIDIIIATGDYTNAVNKEMTKVANIEKAMEMIYYDYTNPLTIEDAALATGYAKSNFCKIFKNITGDTFHNVLNRKRVERACGLLRESNMSITEIATAVGFGETKTFCRVFRAIISCTPGQYRKKKKMEE